MLCSQLHIPTKMATMLVETSSFTDTLSRSAEGQTNSLVSSDNGNDNNNSLETLDVVDNASKYVKHKKFTVNHHLLKIPKKKKNENKKRFSDSLTHKENVNETAETNKEFNWSLATCAILVLILWLLTLTKSNY